MVVIVTALAIAGGALAWTQLGGGAEAATPYRATAKFGRLAQITSGRATIVLADGQRRLTFAKNFWTKAAPDLYVYLVEGAGRGGEINGGYKLARLDYVEGSQQYVIPKNVELDPPFAVVIWCDLCDSAWGHAQFT